MDGWHTVPEVARELGVSAQTVRNWIRRDRLTAIRGVERGVYRIPAPEIEAFKRRNANRARPPYPAVETRDLTSPDAFYEARIAPILEQAGVQSPDVLLARATLDGTIAERFPSFARDYASYVASVADQIEVARESRQNLRRAHPSASVVLLTVPRRQLVDDPVGRRAVTPSTAR